MIIEIKEKPPMPEFMVEEIGPTTDEQTDSLLGNKDIVRNALMNQNIIQEGTKPYKLRPEAIAAIMGNIAIENSQFAADVEEVGDIDKLKITKEAMVYFNLLITEMLIQVK